MHTQMRHRHARTGNIWMGKIHLHKNLSTLQYACGQVASSMISLSLSCPSISDSIGGSRYTLPLRCLEGFPEEMETKLESV